ncbi:hypothetical protein ACJA29_01260 [Metamycoplasma sualvi]|uniref:hypothetical protein n=1 Tax=Metamycoplasma sualvi TaxID=2125 RepID=UPI0038732053
MFISLSFAFKSKDSKVSNDYSNGISLTINPTKEDGSQILEETYSKQLLQNLHKRLENAFPSSIVSSAYEVENVWNIDITSIAIDNLEQTNEIKNIIIEKNNLTLLPINATWSSQLFNSTYNNNSVFNSASNSSGSYSLTFSSPSFYTWAKSQNLGTKVIIWKNLEILKRIVKNAIDNEGYSGTLYEFLFLQNRTPENQPTTDNGTTLNTYFFKDEFIDPLTNKSYKATDFIVSKNELSDFSLSGQTKKTITISKDFGVANSNLSSNDIENEFLNVEYWISTYKLNNYVLASRVANNGSNAYFFLMISLITIFAFVSIFVVINYGYLGIFAIILLAVIIFLALLMISVFFGDYDSFSISAILLTLFISLDFIITFLSNVKKQFKLGNTVNKAAKNTIKNHQKNWYLKAIFLTLFVGIFYVVTSSVLNQFSIIILISCLAVTLVLIPCMFAVSKLLTGLKYFENNPKSIGFIKNKNDKEIKQNVEKEITKDSTSIEILEANNEKKELLEGSIIEFANQNEEKKYNKFEKSITSKKWIFIFFGIILISAILMLVGNFINTGYTIFNGWTLNNTIPNQFSMKISKIDNSLFTNEEISSIKQILFNNGIQEKNISIFDLQTFSILMNTTLSNATINDISQQLTNLYNLVIIPSTIISSDTFLIMRFTMYGILIALIIICALVLIWMDWVKTLVLFLSFIISGLIITFVILVGGVKFNLISATAIIFSFVLLLSSMLSFLSNIHHKLKLSRIELLTKDNIKKIVYYEFFKMIKLFLILNAIIIFTFVLFVVLYGSLPWQLLLLNIIFEFINISVLLLFVPKMLISLELRKARMMRKIINDNFWDTEKIKEQSFKGVNDIK